MKTLLTFILLISGGLLVAQNGHNAVPNSGIEGLKENLNRLLSENKIDSALLYTGLLIRHYQEEGNTYEELRSAIHKAEILRHISSLEEALKIMTNYRSVAENLPLSTVKSVYYNRLAAILFEMGELPAALDAVHTSQKIDSIAGYTWRKFSNWNLEGALFRDLKELDKAQAVLKKTAQYALSQKDTGEYLTALYNLSHHYYRSQNYPNTFRLAREYLSYNYVPHSTGMPADLAEIAAYSAYAMQDYPTAFNLLDSAFHWRKDEMELIIQSRVEAMKMTDDLERERWEGDIMRSQKEADQLRIITLAAALIIVALLSLVFYLSNKSYKQRNAKQAAENQEMQESLKFKNKLISIVAHDIRNPVASIRGMLQLYSQGLVKTNELAEWIDGLETAVANVDLLLENLLNWVKTQKGKIAAQLESIELHTLIENTAKSLSSQMDLKQIKFEPPQQNGLNQIHLKTDPNILAFALRNTLSNAIKFSPQAATLKVRTKIKDNHCILKVIDEGEGMAPEQLEKLFSKEGHSKAGTGAERGTGLGLALSREFLAAMGASLELKSKLGEGTIVYIHIPFADQNT